MVKALLCGESEFYVRTNYKGVDCFTSSGLEFEGGPFIEALGSDISVDIMMCHEVVTDFPFEMSELKKYDVIILSDIGARSFLLHPDTHAGKILPNRLELIRRFVYEGGGLGMMGGYMSFMGSEGSARYRGTPVEEALPVTMMEWDDRVETPEGLCLECDSSSHFLLKGMPERLPAILGYNRVVAKDTASVILKNGCDPLLTIGEYGSGRAFAWATDCAPHWLPKAFTDSDFYAPFMQRLVSWAAGKK